MTCQVAITVLYSYHTVNTNMFSSNVTEVQFALITITWCTRRNQLVYCAVF